MAISSAYFSWSQSNTSSVKPCNAPSGITIRPDRQRKAGEPASPRANLVDVLDVGPDLIALEDSADRWGDADGGIGFYRLPFHLLYSRGSHGLTW